MTRDPTSRCLLRIRFVIKDGTAMTAVLPEKALNSIRCRFALTKFASAPVVTYVFAGLFQLIRATSHSLYRRVQESLNVCQRDFRP